MRRDAIVGLSFWIPVLAALAFGATHTSWYDTWPLAERINFWMALWTGVLALVTASSVLATMNVIGSEDRRHRESFAPICIAIFDRADIYVQNVGLGPATNVAVHGQLTYDMPIHADSVTAMPNAPPKEIGRDNGTSPFQTAIVSVLPAVTVAPGSRDKDGNVIGGAWATPVGSHDELRKKLLWSGPISNIRNVRVMYSDLYGNKYETRYVDLALERYDWVRPSRYV